MRRTNLFPCPLFTGEHGKAANSGDCKLTYQGGGVLTMSPLAGASSGGWCDFVTPVQPGDYVASVYFRFADGDKDFRGAPLSVSTTDVNDSDGTYLNEFTDYYATGRRVLRFTVPDGVSFVRLRFRGSKSRDVTFLNPQVELAFTYDAAVNAAGGGGIRCCSTATPCRKSVSRSGFEVVA